jgi:hypothetical protein
MLAANARPFWVVAFKYGGCRVLASKEQLITRKKKERPRGAGIVWFASPSFRAAHMASADCAGVRSGIWRVRWLTDVCFLSGGA